MAADGDTGAGRDRLGALVGIERLEPEGDAPRARIAVTDEIKQPAGLVHGGVYAVVAESVCSGATMEAVRGEGMVAMGQSNASTFVRPITDGHVNAVARPRHRGRTTWIWDVEITDDDDRLCALVRMTIAVRPARQPR